MIELVSSPVERPEIDWVSAAGGAGERGRGRVGGRRCCVEPEIADVTMRSFLVPCARAPPESNRGWGSCLPHPSIGRVLRHCRSSCGRYWSSFKIVCGAAFACASMAVPACKRIWFLVKLTISSDMSVSTICDSRCRQVLTGHLQVRDRGLEAVLDRTQGTTVARDLRRPHRRPAVWALAKLAVLVTSMPDERGERTVGATGDPLVADRQGDLVVGGHVGTDLEHAATGGGRRGRGRGHERDAGTDRGGRELGRRCPCCCARAPPTRRRRRGHGRWP